MGRLHARVFSQMPSVKLVGVFDANPDAAAETARQFGTTVLSSIDEVARLARAVAIATPTIHHLDAARPLLREGCACLIEKPLARTSAECREIVALGEQHGVVVQVGHIERFNPAVRAVQRLGIAPGFIEVTRISPLTFRSIDVGVVLDVMIHDIDIVQSLVRSPVVDVQATGVSIVGGGTDGQVAEDVCNARLKFETGCVANLTASRLAMKTERRLRVFSSDAYVSLDYQKKYGIVVKKKGNVDALRQVIAQIRSGEIDDLSQLNYQQLVQIEELTIDDVEPARAQLEAFVASVTTGTPVEVPGTDGLRAVETAERIVTAIGGTILG
jgi:predicted dehydrogenase